ncbi:MAG: FAD-binding oxidoreductase, partial [Hoeflea sp.]|nr:FAD-binding oxidoreductase [Hoeflea sp.]
MPTPLTDPSLIARFAAITGGPNALTAPSDIAPHLIELRGLYKGESPLVLRPASTAEVAAILRLANEAGTAIVPQGGNTGLVGGQSPRPGKGEIVLSLSRLNKIRSLDRVGQTMVAEAGVVLQQAQQAASDQGLLFPLSLGSEGSCQIGGNLSSNAGGTAVLAYGNMRQLCLGLEVVLPDGEIWNGLRALKKDNTGYDLRDLFIGAEGTLGVITAAVLKLHPAPLGHETIYAGVDSPETALNLFRLAQDYCGPSLTGFELMPRIGIEFTTRHIEGVRDPLGGPHPWYALIDISSGQSQEAARAMLEGLFVAADEKGLIRDAVAAETEAQRQA